MNSFVKKAALVAAPTVILLGVLYLVFRGGDDELTVNQAETPPQNSGGSVEADAEYVMVGGVRRKRSDIQASKTKKVSETASKVRDHAVQPPPVKVDANPNIESIVEALKTGEHPERLSPLVQPAPFDPEAFDADPDSYLKVVEPGRAFQTAQPGEGVPVLAQLSKRVNQITEGESLRLRVKAAPKSPVSFTSFDGGQFQNQTTAITVRANEQGVGEVAFFATPGAVGHIDVLAGSPTSTGQVRFVMQVAISPE